MDLSEFDDLLGYSEDSAPQAKVAPEPIPGECTEGELSALLGISTGRIRDFARDGMAVKSRRGRYDTRATLSRYLDRLRESAGRAGRPASDEYKAEKTRQARETADKLALQNALLRKELVAVADVRREWVTVATDLRSTILAIPGRVSARMGLSREAAVMFEEEMRMALEELPNER